jgi:hypothetical protein
VRNIHNGYHAILSEELLSHVQDITCTVPRHEESSLSRENGSAIGTCQIQ